MKINFYEKALKRCLKKKVSIDTKTIVIILLSTTLIGCTSSSSGGGSSSGNKPPEEIPPIELPPIEDPDFEIKDGETVFERVSISGDGKVLVNRGTVVTSKDGGILAEKGALAVNEGTINNESNQKNIEGIFGMYADNATISNRGDINIDQDNSVGLIGENNSEAINESNGVIAISGDSIVGIKVTDNSIGINRGEINVSGSNNVVGMYASENSTIINEENGVINVNSEGFADGMYATSDSIAINEGTITTEAYMTEGMIAFDNSTVINEKNGIINATTTTTEGAIGLGVSHYSEGVNEGTINVSGENSKGVVSNTNSTVINNGTINSYGEEVYGEEVYGMWTANDSYVINNGVINVDGYHGVGIYSKWNSHVLNTGIINNDGELSIGIYAWSGSNVINEGTINSKGDSAYAIGGFDNVTVINEGHIKLESDSDNRNYLDAVVAGDGSHVTNNGTIEVIGDRGSGISGSDSTIINDGNINITGDYGTGMRAEYGSLAINEKGGSITIKGDHGIGMHALVNSEIINNGTINIVGNNGIGMKAENNSTITNTGTIRITGSGGQDIVTDDTSEIINEGDINVEGDLVIGEGSNLTLNGGSLTAKSVRGDVNASWAFTIGSLEENYTMRYAIRTEDFDGEVHSQSWMFDAEAVRQDGGKYMDDYYNIEYTRRNFNDITSSDFGNFASILEDNYVKAEILDKDNSMSVEEVPGKENGILPEVDDSEKTDEIRIYDGLKAVGSASEFYSAVAQLGGFDVYPNIAKQTFEISRALDQNTKDLIQGQNYDDNVRYFASYDYSSFDGKASTNTALDYETDTQSIYLGADKEINSNFRMGTILAIADSKADFTGSKSKNDIRTYQTGMFGLYHNDNGVEVLSRLNFNKSENELKRSLNYGLTHGEFENEFDTYVIAFNNEISKNFDMDSYSIKPRLHFNMAKIKQDSVSESGNTSTEQAHELEVGKMKGTSIETGMGVVFSTNDIRVSSKGSVKASLSLDYFHEFKDPYKDLDVNLKALDGEHIVFANRVDENYGIARAVVSYDYAETVIIYGNGEYYVNEFVDNEWRAGGGFRLTF